MSLEKKLENSGIIVGATVGAVMGLNLCLGTFDYADFDSYTFLHQARITSFAMLLGFAIGARGGQYAGKGMNKVINYINEK